MSAVVASIVTLLGNYYLEHRKAQVELRKEIARRNIDLLETIGQSLGQLDLHLKVIKISLEAREARASGAPSSQGIKDYIGNAAKTMANIRQDVTFLDKKSKARQVILALLADLATILHKVQQNPNNTRIFLAFYGEPFASRAESAKSEIRNEIREIATTLPL